MTTNDQPQEKMANYGQTFPPTSVQQVVFFPNGVIPNGATAVPQVAPPTPVAVITQNGVAGTCSTPPSDGNTSSSSSQHSHGGAGSPTSVPNGVAVAANGLMPLAPAPAVITTNGAVPQTVVFHPGVPLPLAAAPTVVHTNGHHHNGVHHSVANQNGGHHANGHQNGGHHHGGNGHGAAGNGGSHNGGRSHHRNNGPNGGNTGHRAETLSRTNLYIRGLQQNCTDDELYKMCEPYGKIVSTKAIVDPATNMCKGYGFVDFDKQHEAMLAVQKLKLNGVQAQMAKERNHVASYVGGGGPAFQRHPSTRHYEQQEQDPTNLYISNLPRQITEPELERVLAAYGSVISTRILRDNNGMSKGVGFARMESKEKCETIITQFNGKYMHQLNSPNGAVPNGNGSVQNMEPLLCKFADGGPKKTKHHSRLMNGNPRSWRGDEGIQYAYGEMAGIAANGAVPNQRVMLHPIQHPGYQVCFMQNHVWLQQPYMMPPQLPPNGVYPQMEGNVHIAPNMVPPMGQLAAQFNNVHIGPPPPAATMGYPMPPPTHAMYQSHAVQAAAHQAALQQMNNERAGSNNGAGSASTESSSSDSASAVVSVVGGQQPPALTNGNGSSSSNNSNNNNQAVVAVAVASPVAPKNEDEAAAEAAAADAPANGASITELA